MTRNILGVVAGVVGWLVVATLIGLVMRNSWPAYAAVAEAMTFTLPMMIARLSIGAVRHARDGLHHGSHFPSGIT